MTLRRLHRFVRSDGLVFAFLALGLLFNSVLHLYRFHRQDWVSITGLWGQPQSISLSFLLSSWTIIAAIFGAKLVRLMRVSALAAVIVPPILVVMNEACGRSMLKLFFDILIVGVFYVWWLIDFAYAKYVEHPPNAEARPFVISELMTLFQISLAILTFVIATFGFSFAPSYIDRYYHEGIGQPTTWWFGFMTLYVSVGVIVFISLQAWALAVRIRQSLE